MARMVVTGGAGFIGGHIAQELLQQGHEVVVLDDFSSGKRENVALLSRERGFRLVEGSIADPAAVERAMRGGVQFVFHLAALPSVPVSMREPERTNLVNIGGTVNVLEGARKAGAQRVVLACSCAAYGDGPEQPKHEGLQVRPMSPYAAQKIAAELYAETYTRAFGLPCVALRFFNVYGPRQDPKSEYAAVIPRFATLLLQGKRPVIFGDGGQTRDFVHVSDVVRANMLAATSKDAPGNVLNVASGHSASLNELVAMLKEAVGPQARSLEAEHQAERAGDLRTSSADLTKTRRILGYEPKVALPQGLRMLVESIRESLQAAA